jgi:xylono-1,5-lactonase
VDWEIVASGYGLAEAPTVDVDGSILFSDVLGGGVHRIDAASGAVATVVPKRRGVGGIAIHADGGIVCGGRDVVHCRAGEEPRTVLHVDGVAGWNDLCTDSSGDVYAGALRFAVFDPDAEAVPGELWRARRDGAEVVFDGVVHANGVACTPDGATIYMSDTRRRRVIVFDVATATRHEWDVAAHGHPDGMAIDAHGAVWIALVNGGIGRFAPDGTLDTTIHPPSPFVTSLCFRDRELFVTTGAHRDEPDRRGCVLRTTVEVAGAPVAPARV